MDYVLINARLVLKKISMVLSFNKRSDHRMLGAKIDERRILNLSSRRKRPMEIDKKKLLCQATDWTMKMTTTTSLSSSVSWKTRTCPASVRGLEGFRHCERAAREKENYEEG